MGKLFWEYKIAPGVQEVIKREKNIVMLGAPHESFMDGVHAAWMFLVMRVVKKSIRNTLDGKKVRIAMKKEMFPKFFKKVLEKVFLPVDRKTPKEFWEKIKNEEGDLIIGYAPEGTRKKVDVWKSGGFRTAEWMNSPIVLGVLDYKTKIVEIVEAIETDDFLTDGKIDKEKMPEVANRIRAVYKNISEGSKGFDPNFKIKIRGQKY